MALSNTPRMRSLVKRGFIASAAVAALALLPLSSASAALLAGAVTPYYPPPAPADLTAGGGLDWAVWNVPNQNPLTSQSGAPTNRKADATPIISNVSAINGTLRGFGGTTPTVFTYSDGTSPVNHTGTLASIGATPLQTTGVGLTFQVTGDPTLARVVQVWAAGYNGLGQLTAQLEGSPDVVLTQAFGAPGGDKEGVLFQLTFQPDSADDVLNVRYVLANENPGSIAHVALQAVAVNPIPEPSLSLAALGGLVILARRRR